MNKEIIIIRGVLFVLLKTNEQIEQLNDLSHLFALAVTSIASLHKKEGKKRSPLHQKNVVFQFGRSFFFISFLSVVVTAAGCMFTMKN